MGHRIRVCDASRFKSGVARPTRWLPFVIKTADMNADKLMRLRSNLCLWGEPPAYSGRGKPRVHGDKFKLQDDSTWSEPEQIIEQEDTKLGRVRIRLWTRKHFRLSPHHSMSIILVERLFQDGSPRVHKPMWLAFVGDEMPPLSEGKETLPATFCS